jgi:hypothetical protein
MHLHQIQCPKKTNIDTKFPLFFLSLSLYIYIYFSIWLDHLNGNFSLEGVDHIAT